MLSAGRFILEEVAVLIGCCVFRLLSNRPPICTGDQPFSLALRSTSNFRRRFIFRRCLPTQLPTLIGCQIVRPAFRSISSFRLRSLFRPNLPVDPRLASPINLPAPPSYRPATCAACRSSSHAFQPTSSFRLQSVFQLDLPANLYDLRLLVNLPALPSNLTSDSHRSLLRWLRLCATLRLTPSTDSLAVPSGQYPTVAGTNPLALPSN